MSDEQKLRTVTRFCATVMAASAYVAWGLAGAMTLCFACMTIMGIVAELFMVTVDELRRGKP